MNTTKALTAFVHGGGRGVPVMLCRAGDCRAECTHYRLVSLLDDGSPVPFYGIVTLCTEHKDFPFENYPKEG